MQNWLFLFCQHANGQLVDEVEIFLNTIFKDLAGETYPFISSKALNLFIAELHPEYEIILLQEIANDILENSPTEISEQEMIEFCNNPDRSGVMKISNSKYIVMPYFLYSFASHFTDYKITLLHIISNDTNKISTQYQYNLHYMMSQ